MYCSICGSAVAQDLSYCNYCGAKLREAKSDAVIKSSEVKPELLVSAMVGLFIFGLLAIAVLLGVMKRVAGFDLPILIAFTVFSFVVMLVLESVLIWLLLKGKRGVKQTRNAKPLKEQKTRELEPAEQARMLPEPVPSVTQDTTRSFEPIYIERKLK